MEAIKQKLIQALSQREKRHIVDTSRTKAAVLVPIYRSAGEYHILFTKRTQQVQYHKGEISFPGGAYEKGDKTLADTALRECEEEIGLTADKVELLGELDDIATFTSNYVISPFVGWVSQPYPLKADPWETEEILEVPVSTLLDSSYHRQETRSFNSELVTMDYYHYQDNVIWGATAKILAQFLNIFTPVFQGKQPHSTDR